MVMVVTCRDGYFERIGDDLTTDLVKKIEI